MCQIYTDVEGVCTADPRLIPEAQKLAEIGYEEMLELASYGAKVVHPRAVELGELFNIPILVASSFTDSSGTLIHGGVSMEVLTTRKKSCMRNIISVLALNAANYKRWLHTYSA